MIESDVRGLHAGDRLTHRESGTPAVVERIDIWGDGRIELTVGFGGNPRTDPWGVFVEATNFYSGVRDLERIVVGNGQFAEWDVTPSPTISEFLLARIAEDETKAQVEQVETTTYDDLSRGERTFVPGTPITNVERRVLAECEAKRRIIEWHKAWPVLVETPPVFEPDSDLRSMTFRISQQIAWATEQQYRDRFGSEPPTGPVLRFLALPYADHPDYRDEWRP